MTAKLLALMLLCFAGQAGAVDGKPSKSPGDLLAIEIALYYAPEPTGDPMSQLKTLCEKPEHPFRVIDVDKDPIEPLPIVYAHWVDCESYQPPDAAAWKFRTEGLGSEPLPTLLESKQALVVEFVVRKSNAVASNEWISKLVAALAESTDGLPWDEETRKLFSAEAWRKNRCDSWHDGIPDVRKHVVMDAYRDDEAIRIVTMGMRKFSLPDLVVSEVVGQASLRVGSAINACAQLLVEGGKVDDGLFNIDLASVRHPEVRKSLLANPEPGAVGKAEASLTEIPSEPGDAKNTLLAIDFPGHDATAAERQMSAMKALFGVKDQISMAKHGDEELQAASDRARAKLPMLRKRFDDGLSTEQFLVKAPFTAEDGRVEYMWVEVTSWTDAALLGNLVNEPYFVKDLKPGSPVRVEEADVFDYIWTNGDGTSEGNETGEILRKLEEEP